MINAKIIEQAVKNFVIFLTFLVALIFIGPYLGFGIYDVDNTSECYSKWFNLTFFLICSYALTCFTLWARKVSKK